MNARLSFPFLAGPAGVPEPPGPVGGRPRGSASTVGRPMGTPFGMTSPTKASLGPSSERGRDLGIAVGWSVHGSVGFDGSTRPTVSPLSATDISPRRRKTRKTRREATSHEPPPSDGQPTTPHRKPQVNDTHTNRHARPC